MKTGHITPDFFRISVVPHPKKEEKKTDLKGIVKRIRARRYQREWYHSNRSTGESTRRKTVGVSCNRPSGEAMVRKLVRIKKWSLENKDRREALAKINREKHREKRNRRNREKYRINPQPKRDAWNKWAAGNVEYFKTGKRRISHLLRCSLRCAVKRSSIVKSSKYTSTESVDFLTWLASKMGILLSTKDHQIDHIIPLSKLDLSNPFNLKMANSPTNVRWMSSFDNNSKNDNWPEVDELVSHYKLVEDFYVDSY
jgi:hypothetical protein